MVCSTAPRRPWISSAGLWVLLTTFDDIDVVASCGDVVELLRVVEELEPDVVLTDIRMPPGHGDEGVRAARQLHASHPDVGVVVLSQFLSPRLALDVFETGARGRGYLRKEQVADGEYLVEALRTVAGGGSFLDDEVIQALVDGRRGASTRLDDLTPRELEVLSAMAAGHTNAVIAEHLYVNERTVEKRISRIFAKLGLTDTQERHKRVAAVLIYLQAGGERDRSDA